MYMAEETPVKMLEKDHRKVEELFNECRQINPNDIEERKDVIGKIINELEIHAELEEQTFYSLVENISQEGKSLIDQSREEHQEMKTIIENLKGMMQGNAIDDMKLSQLESTVLNHVQREERQVFPFAEREASDELNFTFAAKMLALKEKLRLTHVKERVL